MDIGIPRERQPSEYRVGFPPAGVRQLANVGHRVYVESGAGEGAGFSDIDFESAGASIVYSGEEIYGRVELVMKIARPTQQEMVWIRSGQTLLGFLHLNAAPKQEVKPLLEKKITALAYERMQDQEGRYPVLEPLSQIGGRMAATLAARLLQNDSGSRGVLLGGVPGVPPAEVVILGCGTAGANAARAFLGLGAQVTLLDKDLQRLRSLECGLPSRPVTMLSNPHTLQTAFSFADVVVGAVRVPGSRAPVIVTRELLAAMKPGALFIDLSIDEGGCAVTSRPTSHETPTFIEEGVMHCCIPNLPSAVARTSSHAFQIAAWPFVESIITKGVDTALQEDEGMAKGAMVQNGEAVSYRPVNYLEEVEE